MPSLWLAWWPCLGWRGVVVLPSLWLAGPLLCLRRGVVWRGGMGRVRAWLALLHDILFLCYVCVISILRFVRFSDFVNVLKWHFLFILSLYFCVYYFDLHFKYIRFCCNYSITLIFLLFPRDSKILLLFHRDSKVVFYCL